jgi:hypothetical protein
MTWPVPPPEEQVQFLRNLQRLLAEGLFIASYKFALVHALADFAVLNGDDTSGGEQGPQVHRRRGGRDLSSSRAVASRVQSGPVG